MKLNKRIKKTNKQWHLSLINIIIITTIIKKKREEETKEGTILGEKRQDPTTANFPPVILIQHMRPFFISIASLNLRWWK